MPFSKLFELVHHPLQEEEKQELETLLTGMAKQYHKKIVRFLLREHAQTDKEIALFNNNSDDIFTIKGRENYLNEVSKVFQSNYSSATFQQENGIDAIQQIYHLHQQIHTKTNHQFAQLAYAYLANKEHPNATLRIMDVFHQFNFGAFASRYHFHSFVQFMEQYPITLDVWQQLLWNNPDSEHVLYFLIAPMLEQVLGHPPISLEELDEAWNHIHEKTWPADAWLLLFHFACFVKKDAGFIERLSQDNLKILSRDLTILRNALCDTEEHIQEQLISKIEPHEVDLSTIPYLEWLFSAIQESLRLQLFTQLGIDLIAKTQDPSYTLRNIINIFEDRSVRLQVLQQVPEAILLKMIDSPYELRAFFSLFDSNKRLDLSRDTLKNIIKNIGFNSYTLAEILRHIPEEQRVVWLKDVLTWEKLATMEKGVHWSEFKTLFTKEQWSEVRSSLYPGEELTAHFALKSIRAAIKTHAAISVDSIDYLATQEQLRDIPQQVHEGYPLTHANICGNERVIAPPPILEQIHVLRAVNHRELKKPEALEQIKSIGKNAYESLSQPDNPYRQFYSEKGLCFFKTLATEEITEKSFCNGLTSSTVHSS